MAEVCCGLDLPQKAISAECGGEFGAKDLDGDLTVVLEVFGKVDGGHAALAELANDAVTVRECRGESGGKRHAVNRSVGTSCSPSIRAKSLRFMVARA